MSAKEKKKQNKATAPAIDNYEHFDSMNPPGQPEEVELEDSNCNDGESTVASASAHEVTRGSRLSSSDQAVELEGGTVVLGTSGGTEGKRKKSLKERFKLSKKEKRHSLSGDASDLSKPVFKDTAKEEGPAHDSRVREEHRREMEAELRGELEVKIRKELEGEIEAERLKLQEKEDDVRKWKEAAKDAKRDLTTGRSRNEQILKLKAKELQEKDAIIDTLKKDTEKLKETEESLKESRSMCVTLTNSLSKQEARFEEKEQRLQHDIVHLQGQIAQQVEQHERELQFMTEQHEDDIQKIRDELTQQLKEKIKTEQMRDFNRVKELEKKVKAMKDDRDSLNKKLSALAEESDRVKGELNKKVRDMVEERDRVKSELEEKVKALEDERDRVKGELEEQMRAMVEERDMVERLEGENVRLGGELEKQEKEFEAMKDKSQSDAEKLHHENKMTQHDLDEAREKLRVVQAKVDQLEQDKELLQAEAVSEARRIKTECDQELKEKHELEVKLLQEQVQWERTKCQQQVEMLEDKLKNTEEKLQVVVEEKLQLQLDGTPCLVDIKEQCSVQEKGLQRQQVSAGCSLSQQPQ